MKKETENRSAETEARTELKEGVDYYFDNSLMVLTAEFLRTRGYCCKNGCRHCPYGFERQQEPTC